MTSGDLGSRDASDHTGGAGTRTGAADGASSQGERLQKVMAAAGVASRRVSEDLIAAGRVSVNGEVVTEPGRRVLPTDSVSVDGSAIQLDPSRRYLMLNKPIGIVSSLADENGRPDLSRYTRDFDERLFNVGRLDAQTSGLLVLTNDGELAHVLSHPSFGVSKTYIAKVQGEVSAATLRRLTGGIDLDDGPMAVDRVKLLGKPSRGQSMVEVELHSGRNRIVRRMLAAVGHPVVELVRRQFGPLTLGSLGSGQLRDLTKVEVGQLLTLSRAANSEPSEATSDDQPSGRAQLSQAPAGQARAGQARSGQARSTQPQRKPRGRQ